MSEAAVRTLLTICDRWQRLRMLVVHSMYSIAHWYMMVLTLRLTIRLYEGRRCAMTIGWYTTRCISVYLRKR